MNPDHASRLQLPPGPWTSVFECLCAQFPGIDAAQWRERFARQRVLDAKGQPLALDAPFRVGLTVRYFREVEHEVPIPFEASILHVDADLIVVDKPHFLPVIPAGRHVEETVLRRLMRELGNPDLVPLHRIDRATAGLVLFSASPRTRSRYQSLFRERRIEKHYEAMAPALPQHVFPLLHRSRIEKGEPFFRMREVDGEANSETRIDVIEHGPAHWHYALQPVSGRKHQLRVHMAALGAGILNDRFYPDLAAEGSDDHAAPLKLLARSLAFIDPLDGQPRRFESRLRL